MNTSPAIPLITHDFYDLTVRFGLNTFFLLVLTFAVYYPHQKRKNYVFTYLMINVTLFLICYSLNKLNLGIGMALGLFAVFGIIRYRTDAIRIKEMTYLFVIVGMAVVNSMSSEGTSLAELGFANGVILFTALILENLFMKSRKMRQQSIIYDRMEWIAPEHREAMLQDLRVRTGLPIVNYMIKRIDLRAGSANVTAFWDGPAEEELDTGDDMR